MRRGFLLIGISLLLALSIGCSKPDTSKDKIKVIVTIAPQGEFVEKIGGDKVDVSVMVPPGASPHIYEPTPNQLVEVSKAGMYVKVGTPVEFELIWLDKVLSTNRDMEMVDASAGIELARMEYKHDHEGEPAEHEEHEEEADHQQGVDPHIWLSPKNAKIMVENIYKGLISIDSENEKYYTANKEAYIKELSALDDEIKQTLSAKTNRSFMVYHPSWGYFAREYNLEQIPVEEEGKEPTAKSITHLIQQAKENGVKVIFASPQFSTKSAEVVAKEIGGRVVLISSLERDYIANMKKVAEALSAAME